ncbi:hypothetical protein [Metabacillus indicus]|uniref:hypothetical protein n=1 Tax=Metabacillus indicus TaxID=246786 RepID=UPI0004934328|nr:hypothetical protein [Metabacillus indicus]KEZ48810.1 hypothetical protein AZ46_0218200 [Metabacillus indicus LMG 22858]
MINSSAENLLKEHRDLIELKSSFNSFLDSVKAEQSIIKNLLEEVYSWKSGEGREAFLSELEDYNYQYSMKVLHLESAYREIGQAEKEIRNRLNAELSKGPKF